MNASLTGNNAGRICYAVMIVVVVAASAVGSPRLHAQSASVSSSATITAPITGSAVSALDFGTIPRGSRSIIHAHQSGAGVLMFSGDASDDITVTLPDDFQISTSSGDGASMTVEIRRQKVLFGTTAVQAVAEHLNIMNATGLTASLSSDALGNGTNNDGLGQLWIWIGAEVTPSSTQQRGVYTGTVTVSAEYSN